MESRLEVLICRRCGQNAIPMPREATPETRFICRTCCGRIAAKRARTADDVSTGNAADPTLVRIERLAQAVSIEQAA